MPPECHTIAMPDVTSRKVVLLAVRQTDYRQAIDDGLCVLDVKQTHLIFDALCASASSGINDRVLLVVSQAMIVSQAINLSHTIILPQAISTLLSHAQTYWKTGREQFAKQSKRLPSLKAAGKGGNKGSRGCTPQSPDAHHFQSPSMQHTCPELDVPDLQDDAPQLRVCLCVCLCVCFCVWVWVWVC